MTSEYRHRDPHWYHLTKVSNNAKTGGIPVSMTSKSTCPKRCAFDKNGCYAESGPLAMHWNKVTEKSRGSNLSDFCTEIRALPKHQLWRWAQAGDLPGDGTLLDEESVQRLTWSNRGRHGFGYTHYDPRIPHNSAVIAYANVGGFVINLSAETLAEADEYAELELAPVVVVLPVDYEGHLKTPQGRRVTVCPAAVGDTTCAICAICSVADRKAIIGFPAHGTGKAKVEKVFYMAKA